MANLPERLHLRAQSAKVMPNFVLLSQSNSGDVLWGGALQSC